MRKKAILAVGEALLDGRQRSEAELVLLSGLSAVRLTVVLDAMVAAGWVEWEYVEGPYPRVSLYRLTDIGREEFALRLGK